ncbi:MAG: hypothetical protein JNK23_03915 [Opitutaceae bacterium]|nr:hypothetical protein [Opitutaceae bacterium]
MRKKFAIFSLLFAWLCANGALLDGVQVFAWAKMFAGYAKVMPAAEALRVTFDPMKPCDMCLGIASAKETAKQQLPHSPERAAEKLLIAYHATSVLIVPQMPDQWPAALASAGPNRVEKVPVPPPRA